MDYEYFNEIVDIRKTTVDIHRQMERILAQRIAHDDPQGLEDSLVNLATQCQRVDIFAHVAWTEKVAAKVDKIRSESKNQFFGKNHQISSLTFRTTPCRTKTGW